MKLTESIIKNLNESDYLTKEDILNGELYNTVDQVCPMCKKKYVMFLNWGVTGSNSQYSRYLDYYFKHGYIQDLLWDLNPLEREFLKTGYCPECQRKLFNNDYKSTIIYPYKEARSIIAQANRNKYEKEKAERQREREESRARRQPELDRLSKQREERMAKGITTYSLRGKKQDVLNNLKDNLGPDYYVREPGIDGILTIRRNDSPVGIRAYLQNKTLPDDQFGLVFEPVISNKFKDNLGNIYNMGTDYRVNIGDNEYTGKAYKIKDIPRLVKEIKKILGGKV